jgi:hypothetical protein
MLWMTDLVTAKATLRSLVADLELFQTDLSTNLATSLQVQFARWAGPAFSDVPHLGQTTTSPVEGNHAVYKRPAAAGGAGVSSKTAPEVMLSRMDQLHSARAEKLNSVRDQSLQLPCRILDDSSIAVTKHLTRLAISLLDEQRTAAIENCYLYSVSLTACTVKSSSGREWTVRVISAGPTGSVCYANAKGFTVSPTLSAHILCQKWGYHTPRYPLSMATKILER